MISKNITKRLKIESPKSPQFYLKPKLNKGGIPGRPDVSCYLSKISEYVDYHLQSIVKGIPSYVKDKSNFLQEINNVEFFPDNSCFVWLDVKSLYTSIRNVEGIKAAKKSLGNHPKRTLVTYVITTCLALILTLNNFIFNSTNYLHTKSCAMIIRHNIHESFWRKTYSGWAKKWP